MTVGTTLFESLIEAVSSPSVLSLMAANGFSSLIIQYGKGARPQLPIMSGTTMKVEMYDFKASLREDMIAADFIICHAGAGTVMEALALPTCKEQRKIAVVINSQLMDNHQIELAQAMGSRRHLYVLDDPQLLLQSETWTNMNKFQPVPKEPGDAHDFSRILDSFLGFDKNS